MERTPVLPEATPVGPESAQLRRPRPRLATSAMLKGFGRARRRNALIVQMGTNTPTGSGRQSLGIELERLFAFGSEPTATASLLM
jgi:hypothetical protein